MNWKDIISKAQQGNPTDKTKIIKSEEEWKAQLSEEEYRVTRLKGTERPFTGQYCSAYEPGIYNCLCCNTSLFDSTTKFESGTGWPSFTTPIEDDLIAYEVDNSYGMTRVEILCNICDAHLGHVFPDGPQPTGLRYCVNSLSLVKDENTPALESEESEVAILGGGCFWCVEAVFQELKGVLSVESGYAGGQSPHPTYKEVCSGRSGHAEVIKVVFDPSMISFEEILTVFFTVHDPTTLNRQGNDVGTQYRSVIFYQNESQKETACNLIAEIKGDFPDPIVTEISPAAEFYPAEEEHQNFYRDNPGNSYCRFMVPPKLKKLREKFANKLNA